MGLPTSKRKRHAPPNNCRYRKLTKRTVVAASGENQIFMNISNEGNEGSLYKLLLLNTAINMAFLYFEPYC